MACLCDLQKLSVFLSGGAKEVQASEKHGQVSFNIINTAKTKYRNFETYIPRITINVPVVYMVRYKVVLRGDYP